MAGSSVKVPEIRATRDYSIFLKIDSNREIVRSHLKRLKVCIETKNLLYLFPIVVNRRMEVVDGQHRLAAAKELGLDIFYLVDDTITKADIAMVNSNRKNWSGRDYIDFYAKEGLRAFVRLKTLMRYGVSSGVASRLMDDLCVRYTDGGGRFNQGIKSGKLRDDEFAMAGHILELCDKLDRDYAFNPFFVLDIKNAIVQSDMKATDACARIYEKRRVLPVVLGTDETFLRILKDILGIRPKGMTQQEVDEYLDSQRTRRVA